MESAPVCIGGNTDTTVERPPERFCGAQTAVDRDEIERGCRGLQLGTGGLDADPLDVTRRRLADLGGEHSAEMPAAHCRSLSEQIEAMIVEIGRAHV